MTIISVTLVFILSGLCQHIAEPRQEPTELETLVKSKSIDKLRAKFLQAKNDDVRDEVRAAILTLVGDAFGYCSKQCKSESKCSIYWPEFEHRGYIDLNRREGKQFHTIYGSQLNAFARPGGTLRQQVIIVAGEVEIGMTCSRVVILGDTFKFTGAKPLESIVVAAGSISCSGGFDSTLVVGNSNVDTSIGIYAAVFSQNEIRIDNKPIKWADLWKSGKASSSYFGDGKTPDTGLTFFKLADLGLACKLDSDKAVVVESVKVGSAAETGKLKAGDVLKLVNGRPVKTLGKVEELFRYAMMDSPKAKVTISRGQESLDLEILFP